MSRQEVSELPARPTSTATASPAAAGTAASTATATATGSAATATKPTATAAATGWLRTGFIDVHGSPVQFGAIQLRNSGLGRAGIGHFDKGEAAGLAGVTVCNNVNALDVAVLCKRLMKFILRSLVAEISNENVGH